MLVIIVFIITFSLLPQFSGVYFFKEIDSAKGLFYSSTVRRIRKPMGILSQDVESINQRYREEIEREVGKRKVMAVGCRGVAAAVFPAIRRIGAFDIINLGVTGTEKTQGRSGALQDSLKDEFGHIIGMAKLFPVFQAALPKDTARLKKKILNYTITRDALTTYGTLREVISNKIRQKGLYSYPELSAFINDILNAAQIIDEHFVNNSAIPNFNIENKPFSYLLDIAVRYKVEAIKKGSSPDSKQNRIATWVLEKIYGINESVHLLVPSYDEATPYVVYKGIDIKGNVKLKRIIEEGDALIDEEQNTVTIFGDKNFIEFRHDSKIINFGLAIKRDDVWIKDLQELFMQADEKFIREIKDSNMFVMGVDLFFATLLPVLATPGVIDALIQKRQNDPDFVSVFIFEHVNMLESNNLSVMNRIEIIENIANRVVSEETRKLLGGRQVRFGDIFNNVIVNRTRAKEIDKYLTKHNLNEFGDRKDTHYDYEKPIDKIGDANIYVINTDVGEFLGGIDEIGNRYGIYVDSNGNYMGKGYVKNDEFKFYSKDGTTLTEIPENCFLLNKYTYFLLKHPEMKQEWQLKDKLWKDEWEYLGGLRTAPFLYSKKANSERGRYYDAVYATDEEISYLESQGVRVDVVPIVDVVTKSFYIAGKEYKENFVGINPDKLQKILEKMLP